MVRKCWSAKTRKRAAKDRRKRKLAKLQRKHLENTKSPLELRRIQLKAVRKGPKGWKSGGLTG